MDRFVFHLIPHTHWDREWYLPRAAFTARLVGMLDDLLARLEADDTGRFLLDGQTALLDDYLRVRPEHAGRIEALVRVGRLQIGPWYVLPDEQIPAGEALLRNLLLGRRDAERLGGRCDVLYSPDAFGHPESLPDLGREFGLETAVLWRGVPVSAARGRDLMRWCGPAGGELLVYLLPPGGYEVGSALAGEGPLLAAAWGKLRGALVARAAGDQVAVFVGADHHWVHPDVRGLRERIAALEPGHEVRVSRVDDFLRAAGAAAGDLPRASGELRAVGHAWALQGVHGTRLPLKRRNSALELLLGRVAEPLAALARPNDDLRALLSVAWRALVANHFHDSISGTVADPVAREMTIRFADAEVVAQEVSRRALHRLLAHQPDRLRVAPGRAARCLVVWNPVPRVRSGVVLADTTWFRRDILIGPPAGRLSRRGTGAPPFGLAMPSGRAVPVQVVGRRIAHRRLEADRHYPDQDEVDVVRVACDLRDLPGLGFAQLAPGPARGRPAGDVRARGARVANSLLSALVRPGGAIDLTDRRSGERYGGLLRLEDEVDAGDAYTFARARGRPTRSLGRVRIRVLAAGPLVGVLEARWVFPRGCAVRLVVRLHAASPIVHCRLELDNRLDDHRVRLRLPTGLAGAELLAGTQFGAAWRTAAPGDRQAHPSETPVPTAPVHRVAAAARRGRGLALLTPGFAEVEWTADGDLLLTVLRAVGQLSRDDLPTRPGHAAWPLPTPLAQCRGCQVIELALAPLSLRELGGRERLFALWEDAFVPPQAFWLPDAADVVVPDDAIRLDGAGLFCSAVKPAEESAAVVLRCCNLRSVAVDGAWRFARARRAARRVRGDERGGEPVPLRDGGRTLPFHAGPHQWVTHLVE